MPAIPAGRYAYRFGGFSMDKNEDNPFALVGVGLLTVEDDGGLSGVHQATSTHLAGTEAQHLTRRYDLGGSIKVLDEEMREATIVFTAPEQTMEGKLVFVPAGDPGRYWLISTTAKLLPSGEPARETVSGELIRLPDAQPA